MSPYANNSGSQSHPIHGCHSHCQCYECPSCRGGRGGVSSAAAHANVADDGLQTITDNQAEAEDEGIADDATLPPNPPSTNNNISVPAAATAASAVTSGASASSERATVSVGIPSDDECATSTAGTVATKNNNKANKKCNSKRGPPCCMELCVSSSSPLAKDADGAPSHNQATEEMGEGTDEGTDSEELPYFVLDESLVMDESMCGWCPETATGGRPTMTFEPRRKPIALGTMICNRAEHIHHSLTRYDNEPDTRQQKRKLDNSVERSKKCKNS